MRVGLRRSLLALPAVGALLVGGVAAQTALDSGERAEAATCAPGFTRVVRVLAEIRPEMRSEGEGFEAEEHGEKGEREADEELRREAVRELPMLAGVDPEDWDHKCVPSKRPEPLKELLALFGARAIPRMAPYGTYADGAAAAAAKQRAAMAPGSVKGTDGTGSLYGKGPLIVNDPRYPQVNSLGLVHNSGRVDGFAWDPQGKRLFAAVGNGGIWRSDDFCGQCDTLNKLGPDRTVFKNGLATNVGGSEAPEKGTAKGWHVVAAKGLPNRYITSIAIDPRNDQNVFVTLGGYTRRWLPPGAVGDSNDQLGTGHVFRSTDGGQTFTDVSGNLPDAPASWVELRGDQLLVGTDVGAFASQMRGAYDTPTFAPLKDIPATAVSSVVMKPGDPNTAVVAVFGRGVRTYSFKSKLPVPVEPPAAQTPTMGTAYSSYDFDSGAQGWTTSGLPTWQLGAPGHGSDGDDDPSGSAYAVSGPLGLDSMDAAVASPAITAPAGPTLLEWWMKLDTEGGYDFVNVQWSPDGSTWNTLASYSGKNDTAPSWERFAVPFDSPGGNVQVRFEFTSDELCSGAGGPICSSPGGWDGVHVDDVAVGEPAS